MTEDFTLDLFLGPSWPLASPAVNGNERAIGSQELGLAKTEVVGPAQFAAAPPRRAGARPDDRLVAVTAARVAQDGAPIVLDSTTAIDLTRRVDRDGIVRWDVPAGRWILFAFWQAPTRQVASSYPATGPRVVDHFSRTATDAVLEYFDENVLAPQDRRALGAAEQIFTDSYEMQAELLWTHDFLAEFRTRRGYDLTRYLPVVFVPGQHRLGPYYTYCSDRTRRCSPPPPAHEFAGDAGKRVRRDYYQTLSELWVGEHLTPLRQWSNRRGLSFSDEPFGLTADVIEGAKAADVPKAEDHWNRTVDFIRTVTSGAHLAGRRKASMELGTAFDKDYMMTLRELKRRADKSFASGVNELVVLGHPYRKAPGTDWPTWQPFSTEFFPAGFSEAWNSANPLWRHMGPLADYLARGQTLLRQGEPVADVAVYRDSYGYMADPFATDDPPEPALTRELSRSGYAYDFVNPATLLERGTRARDGRLRAGVPEYRGLVVDTDFDRGMNVENHAMDPAVAERLVDVARAGVPIVFVGALPQRGVSFRDPGTEDEALRRALDRLRRSPRVRVVDDAAAVPAALAALGARADLAFDAPQDVYGVHRRDKGRDLWFLWNRSEQPVRFTGSFAARGGTPQRWDMWTGRVSRLARYRESRGRVHVPITLDPLETTVIAFERGSRLHVVETDAEETAVDDGRLVLRSTTRGVRHAVLSNGARRTVRFPALPAARALAQWDLQGRGCGADGRGSPRAPADGARGLASHPRARAHLRHRRLPDRGRGRR